MDLLILAFEIHSEFFLDLIILSIILFGSSIEQYSTYV